MGGGGKLRFVGGQGGPNLLLDQLGKLVGQVNCMMADEIIASNEGQLEVVNIHAEEGLANVLLFTACCVVGGQRVQVVYFDEGGGEAAPSGYASVGGNAGALLLYYRAIGGQCTWR